MSQPISATAGLRFWLLYFTGWLAFGLWQGSNVLLNFHAKSVQIAAWKPLCWEISSVLLIGALAILVSRFESRFPLTGPGWFRRLAMHVPAALIFSLLHIVGMIVIRMAVYASVGETYDYGALAVMLLYESQKDVIAYAAIVAVSVAVRVFRQRRGFELALARSRSELAEARMGQLIAQIQPHFVFNTLNAIANRMHEDIDAADHMLVTFADLLRAALDEDVTPWTDAMTESTWLRGYCSLIGERYRDQVETRVTVEADAATARLPRLLLQPLVENAFRHGLPDGRGEVEVRIARIGDRLRCTINDDGIGVTDNASDGLGLANVRRRLALLYPDNHRLSISRREPGGTAVELDIPFECP